MANQFDQLEIDIVSCHRRIEADSRILLDRLDTLGLPYRLLHRSGLYPRFVDSGFIRYWFDEFSRFWTAVLGGRPLRFHDFFFLYGHYRIGFQRTAVENEVDAENFLEQWQRPENVYQVFASVYRDALDPFIHQLYLPYVRTGDRILEYGCGAAPIVTGFLRADKRSFNYTIADIESFNYAYAKWRLLNQGVTCINVTPLIAPPLTDSYDVVFLMTVLEHLPDPLSVVQELTRRIVPGGRLIFDFILGKGDGLDTIAGVEQRAAVLQYLADNYRTMRGELNKSASMGTTVLEKL